MEGEKITTKATESHEGEHRSVWSSKFGFLMAAIGSAVGLGNIWRFPYVAAQYGGALFLIVYLAIVVVLGIPMVSLELAIGRNAKKSVVGGAFKSGKHNWSAIGWVNVATTFLIASFYCVIGGWVIRYIGGYAFGGEFVSGGNYADVFKGFISSKWSPTIATIVFLVGCLTVLSFGIKGGIEKVSKILMPALFFMLVFVVICSLTMDGAVEGLKFFLVPNMERLHANGGIFGLINAALGQAFFSLSLGMGITMTYGSYLKKETNIIKDTMVICGFDTLMATLAGFAIFPAIFSAGIDPSAGAGLLFISLPAVFNTLGVFGIVIAVVFFTLVLFAALTSAISILEVLISSLREKMPKLNRLMVTHIVGAIVLVSASLVSLSQSGMFKIDLLELFDMVTVKFMLPPAAFLICIYATFILKPKNVIGELSSNGEPKLWKRFYAVDISIISPLIILSLFISGLIGMDFSAIFIG